MSDEYSDDFDEDEVKKKSLTELKECMKLFEIVKREPYEYISTNCIAWPDSRPQMRIP